MYVDSSIAFAAKGRKNNPSGAKPLSRERLCAAKRSFVTRRVDLDDAVALDPRARPRAGDVCLARVTRLGHHKKLELPSGRRAVMHEGDEIILSFGNRYATDQFHARVPKRIGACQLVAAGGIAAELIDRHASTKRPTDIDIIGTLRRSDGGAINLADYALAPISRASNTQQSHVIVVLGSGMNAGKTTSVCEILRALRRANLSVAAIKLTGTGAGGDLWKYLDSGASHALDFTDAGHASTMGLDAAALDRIFDRLVSAVDGKVDCIIAEVADGLLQRETRMVLDSPLFRERVGSLVLATPDPLSALGGRAFLDRMGYRVAAFTGRISASPLFVEELREVSSVPVLTSEDLAQRDSAPLVLMQDSSGAVLFEEVDVA